MKKIKNSEIVSLIKSIYSASDDEYIALHEPKFISDEKDILNNCIDSTYVSTIGEYVTKFEENIKDFYIDDSKLYILVEIDKENTQLLHVYDLNTGKVLNRIRLK